MFSWLTHPTKAKYTHCLEVWSKYNTLTQENRKRTENNIEIVSYQMDETTQFIDIIQQLYFNNHKT